MKFGVMRAVTGLITRSAAGLAERRVTISSQLGKE